MGWTSTQKPVGMSAVEFIKGRWGDGAKNLIASAQVGGVVYFAIRSKAEGYLAEVYEADADGTAVGALVYLVEEGSGPYGFSYKDMDETMGPYDEGKCPASILSKLSPLKAGKYSSYAENWRKRQKAYGQMELI